MRIKERLRAGTAVALVLALTGCGGGSGDGVLNPGNNNGFNLQTGITNLVNQGLTANVALSGSVVINNTQTPVTGSGTYSLSAGITTTFNNTAAKSQVQTLSGTATANGQSLPVSQSVKAYYASSNSNYLGQTATDEYDVAQAPFQYPTSIEGGSSGTLGTVLRYSDSTMSTPLGTATTTFVIAAATTSGGPLGVAITTKTYDTTNTLVETDVTNYSISTTNVISFVSASTQATQGTLTVTAQ
jgi:hypothetical protein